MTDHDKNEAADSVDEAMWGASRIIALADMKVAIAERGRALIAEAARHKEAGDTQAQFAATCAAVGIEHALTIISAELKRMGMN